MKIGSYIKIRNNKKNNCGTTEEQQGNTDNNDNNIYLYLLNKYRVENRSNFSEYMKKVRELKEDDKWIELNGELQQKLISEL